MLQKEFRKKGYCVQMDSDTNLVLRPDSVLIMVDRQTQPSSADIQKMQFMRVTNIHHSEIFRLRFVVLLKV